VNIFSWAMLALGLVLVVYTVLLLLRSDSGRGRRNESIGCGFVLMAGLVWGLGLSALLDDRMAGMRLGVGLAFVLPTVAALFRRGRGGILLPLVLLFCAILLSASALPRLVAWTRGDRPQNAVQKLENTERQMRRDIAETVRHRDRLAADRIRLTGRVRAMGHGDFESISKDPQGYKLLEELGEVDSLKRTAEQRLTVLRGELDRITDALRRVDRLVDSERVTGERANRGEIRRIVDDSLIGKEEGAPATVEEHVKRRELQELFEQEF